MTVEDVIREYAKRNGYDGLVGDGCGCEFDYPCGYAGLECEFGYVCPCQSCDPKIRENCNSFDSGEFDYMVLRKKCEMRLRREKGECDV